MSRLTALTLDDRGFAFDPATGTSYTLNPAAALLVRGLRDGLDAEALTRTLAETFAIERERAARDLAEFTAELTKLGLA
jgi:PqqD family protein of HPr-rel-A system